MTRDHILPCAVAVAAGLGAAFSAAAQPAKVVATGAYCRPAPAGAPAGACYVTLTASTDDRLIAVETTAADHGEVHTMSMDGGVMRMRRLADGLALPAGRLVALKPGGEHLMLIGPKKTLAAGGRVALTLRFAKSSPITLEAPLSMGPVSQSPGGHP